MEKPILNCVPSNKNIIDWTTDKVMALSMLNAKFLSTMDYREDWWVIKNQEKTGACVGYAASGLLKWYFTKAGLIEKGQELSTRFLWMANKETDDFNKWPTTFLERAGTSTKSVLRITQQYGCVLEELLPMQGSLCDLDTATFYSIASRLRIKKYYGLEMNVRHWKIWLAKHGPILARVNIDNAWLDLDSSAILSKYNCESRNKTEMGHAICVVGFTPEHFILRNSWGTEWGDRGYAYATEKYALSALSDLYGVIV